MSSLDHERFLGLAIAEAERGVTAQDGGPFGAVVVRDGAVIASGHNRVTSTNDPTAHAEVVAVRAACATLKSFQLDGCDVYASAEPCPMCMGALYWARPRAVYFAATREDAAQAGFDDAFIYDELALPIDTRKMTIRHVVVPTAQLPFELWAKLGDKIRY